jgi:S-adenosylmethionine hydrolase
MADGYPIITLTTDFGWGDAYVGAIKGVILTICRDAMISDVSHGVPPQNVGHGAFLINAFYSEYPADTVHLCVVDPGVGSNRRAVALITPMGRFVAPDNGLLTRVIESLLSVNELDICRDGTDVLPVPSGCQAYSLEEPKYWKDAISTTFHGRDLFAPVAAHIATGVNPANLGPKIDSIFALPEIPLSNSLSMIEGEVAYIDSFGNLITNIPKDAIGKSLLVVEVAGREIEGIVTKFADCEGLMVLIGSLGYLEVALRDGNAAAELKAHVGQSIKVRLKG